MDNYQQDELLPNHMPVDMAFVPDLKPYEHTHVIHTNHEQSVDENKLAKHSLSPEKLGVVGYIKDVAGFVKDVVHERRERKTTIARRNSTSSISSTTERRSSSPFNEEDKERVQRRRSSSVEQQTPSSPLADAVTSLFPGVVQTNTTTTHTTGCTHAEELRNQMMQMNEQHSHNNNKLL
uniref:uncharacterized protein n=1 Tax=Cokeromyces recurvatus TaxID=90255 RepID=UPI00221F33B2|nr:uncharacterized protein BX663DRAFT_512519 [Cokeromyces recurvatus]KAI7901819.1 hypothetical protein BX663DRAFT_512519 [Cokeromyces recurvatus]